MSAHALGYKAYANDIHTPCHDPDLMALIGEAGQNTDGLLQQWINGNEKAKNEHLREQFPELYD